MTLWMWERRARNTTVNKTKGILKEKRQTYKVHHAARFVNRLPACFRTWTFLCMCNVLCNCKDAQQFRYITCPATKAYLCIFTDGSAYVSSDTRLPFLNKQRRSENAVLGDRESSTDNTSKPSYSSRSDIDKPRGQNVKPFIENDFPKQITCAFRGHELFRAHRGKTPFGPTHPTELTRCLE